MLFFVGSHFVLSSLPIRTPVITKIGDKAFAGLYSLIALAGMIWIVMAYRAAPDIVYWEPHTAFKHLSLSLMPVATICIVAGTVNARKNLEAPDVNGPRGIFRITRHPMMWGTALWGILHVLGNGDGAALILFSGFSFLAIIGTHLGDRRKALTLGDEWQRAAAQTSNIPFAAIFQKRTEFKASEIGWLPVIIGFAVYLVLLILHETFFGIAPMSWVSGLFD